MTVRKSSSNLQIIFCQNISIDVSYDIQESWSFILIIRTMKKKVSQHFNIFTTASAVFELRLMLINWLKPSLNLVKSKLMHIWKSPYVTVFI